MLTGSNRRFFLGSRVVLPLSEWKRLDPGDGQAEFVADAGAVDLLDSRSVMALPSRCPASSVRPRSSVRHRWYRTIRSLKGIPWSAMRLAMRRAPMGSPESRRIRRISRIFFSISGVIRLQSLEHTISGLPIAFIKGMGCQLQIRNFRAPSVDVEPPVGSAKSAAPRALSGDCALTLLRFSSTVFTTGAAGREEETHRGAYGKSGNMPAPPTSGGGERKRFHRPQGRGRRRHLLHGLRDGTPRHGGKGPAPARKRQRDPLCRGVSHAALGLHGDRPHPGALRPGRLRELPCEGRLQRALAGNAADLHQRLHLSRQDPLPRGKPGARRTTSTWRGCMPILCSSPGS